MGVFSEKMSANREKIAIEIWRDNGCKDGVEMCLTNSVEMG